MTAALKIDLAAALMVAARAALHVAPGQALDERFLRTLRNNVRNCSEGREEWSLSMEQLRDALLAYWPAALELQFGPLSDVEEPTPLDTTPEEDAMARAETERARLASEAYDRNQRGNHSVGPNLRAPRSKGGGW